MQIQAIRIHHLLSFDTFTWERLDPHLNVIVGPNGAGKTNLFHALRAVRNALSPGRGEAATRWANTGHQGAAADTITIALDLRFTIAWEQRLLCTFFAAVLCNQEEIQQIATAAQRNLASESLKQFATWVQEHLHPENISWLFNGRLVVTHTGRQGWRCHYEACPGKPAFRLDLSGGGTLVGHAAHNTQTATQNWGSLFVAWRNSLTAQERAQLDDALVGAISGSGFPIPDLSRLPNWVSSQQGVVLRLEDRMQIVDPTTLATHQAFTSTAQMSLKPGEFIEIRSIFQLLLDQALVFTNNVRTLPHRTFVANNLFAQPVDLSNGEQLARFLFRKKNGNPSDRKQYAAAQGLFSRMTGRRFDVVFSPAETEESQFTGLGKSQQESSPDVSLELVTDTSRNDIPLEFSGAGITEALFLSAILAGSTGQVVLLDEPALNLHPAMQAMLLNELLELAHRSKDERSQFLVNTHAPDLVPSDAIDRVSRFTLERGQRTVRHALDLREIDRHDLADLRQLLRGNLGARALLFCHAALLLEGETELATLPLWCPELARQDIALYVAGGAEHFVRPLKFIQHFAIPWAIIGDGEMLWNRRQKGRSSGPQGNIRTILATSNQQMPSVPGDPGENPTDFAQWRHHLETYGVFTLANSASEGFEKALESEIPPDLWELAKTKFGSNKVACGRFIAENCSCPQSVAALIQRVLSYLQKHDTGISLSAES